MERDYGGTSGSTGEAKEQVKHQGKQLTSQARQQASELATRGGEQVKSQLANQKHEASQRLMPILTALRETSQQLRKQGQGSTAGYTDKAADGVERVSGYLRETDVDEMVNEGRRVARSRPALFLGGALTLGFLGARFLKSSAQDSGPAEGGSTTSSRAAAGSVEGRNFVSESDHVPAAPAGGQPLSDRYAQVGRTEPPQGS